MRTLLEFTIYLLAVYGGMTLIISIFGAYRRRAAEENQKVKLVLIVKNVEECAEYIVRTIIKGEFASRVMSGKNVTIIDMNSSDSTAKILNKLKKDFESLDILSSEEKERAFDDFD